MQKFWKYFFVILLLITTLVWFAVITYPDQNLKIIACDVGQGDAILVVHRSTQIIIDGGPNNKIIDCLSDYVPFYDRKIEAVMISHPQKDHYGGIIDVIERYDVKTLIATGLDSVSQDWQVLKNEVGSRGVRVINPSSGQELRIGLIQLDILYPSAEYVLSESTLVDESKDFGTGGILGAFTSNKDPNEFSIVAILSFYDFDALFTGDINPAISDAIADSLNGNLKKTIEYIKVPHHGSRNGLSAKLLDKTNSQVAVISVGKNNSYGHPHEEILKMLSDRGIKILRTDQLGDVVVESDGERIWIE